MLATETINLLCIRLTCRQYDGLIQAASDRGISVRELIRRVIAANVKDGNGHATSATKGQQP